MAWPFAHHFTAASLHLVDGGVVLVAVAFMVAQGTCVELVPAQSLGPTIVELDTIGVEALSGSGCARRRRRARDDGGEGLCWGWRLDRCVGTVVSPLFGRELAKPILVFSLEESSEGGNGLAKGGKVPPFVASVGEDSRGLDRNQC